MKNLLIFVPFLSYLCSCSKNETPFIVINDRSFGIERLLFGDLTNMNDMFLPPLDENISSGSEEIPDKTTKTFDFEYLNVNKKFHDVNEFNEITRLLNNATRRYNGKYYGFNDPEDSTWWWYWQTGHEPEKKEKLVGLNIQFLVHARYQIKKTLNIKDVIRMDKRYKIGYLCNRLRRIKYEQQKLVSYAVEQEKSKFSDLTSLLTLYEKMVRFDVDIGDTIKWIQEIDKEPPQNIQMPGILTPIYTSNQVKIEELFRTLSKTNQFDNIPKPPNIIMKNLSINLDKLNFTTIVSKIKGFSFNITAEDDLKDTRRLAWIGSRSQWNQGSKLLVQNKLYDLMLQLIYMARHKIKQVENEAYYNPADTSYRIAFLYRRLRRIWKKMLDIYTTMIKKQDAGGVFMTVNPFLILHHKAVKLHVDFVYLWWVLVKLHERYDYRHGIFISTPPNFNKN